MNVEKRLEKLEEALAPPLKVTVEIVDDGDDIVIVSDGKVIKRVILEEDEGGES